MAVGKICAWFGIARRSAYYKPVKAKANLQQRFAEPIRKVILEEPSFGYRTVADLPGCNKNMLQRIFELKGRQFKKRHIGLRPRV